MNTRQHGAVMIMVLWTAVVMTILVTVLAASVRLSATTAFHNKAGNQDYAAVMASMHKAEMELMMERMPVPVGQELTLNDDGEFRIPAYRFNGQPLTLNYAADDNVVVRIYDHAGKINLNRLERDRMQQVIEKQLGEGFDPRQVQALLAAWADWTDLNALMTPGGAEDEYYQALETPYTARNVPEMDSVEELRLIRGFDELFGDINLDAAFTIYGSGPAVNPNLATREALLLLPGLVELDIAAAINAAGLPSTRQISAVNYVLSLLALKLAGQRRVSHVEHVAADPGLAAIAGLSVLPKATALGS